MTNEGSWAQSWVPTVATLKDSGSWEAVPCGRPLQLVPKLLFPFPVCVTVEEALTSGGTEATFGLQVLELVQCDFFFF